VLEENNCRISTILITHRHRDHVGGIGQVLEISKNEKPVVRKFSYIAEGEDGETE
jgi:glyoxylase-like metal-dependent hydrolase (beta-lactamase superfamily II)